MSRPVAAVWRVVAFPVSTSTAETTASLLRPNLNGRSLIVDVGAGSGVTARRLLKEGFRVEGVDSSPVMVEMARGIAVKVADAASLPYEKNSVSALVYNHVFRYLDDLDSVIAEAERVLAPSGYMVVSDLNLPRLPIDGRVLGLWGKMSRTDFIDYMKTRGFTYQETRYPLMSFSMLFRRGR